jgi:hypothetical protein
MPAYRLELFLANGQIAQTLVFFSLDDEQALGLGLWGDGVGLAWSLLSGGGVGGQQAGRQIVLRTPTAPLICISTVTVA